MSEQSPLGEAKPDSIEELFRRDPLKLSDGDVDEIIKTFREKRASWIQQELEGKPRAKRAPKAKGPELDLSDLD